MAPTGAEFVAKARSYVGTPYVFGGHAPGGFDCSGLVYYCLNAIGLHTTAMDTYQQWPWCQKLGGENDLLSGDLIFENPVGIDEQFPGHVVIWAGDGQVVEAPHTGEDVRVRAWSPSEASRVSYCRVPGLLVGSAPPPPSAGRTVRSSAQVAPVVTWDENSLHAFAAAADGSVEYAAWNGESWNPWVNLGGTVNPTYPMPVPVAWGVNHLDVFCVDPNSHIIHKGWGGSAWNAEWDDLGNSGMAPGSAPVAVSQESDSLDVFYMGPSHNTIWRRSWRGSWGGWTDLGSIPSAPGSAPAVCTWGADRLDACVVGAGKTVMHSGWDGGTWGGGWEDIGGNPAYDPALVSWGPNRLDVFIVGTDGNLWHNSWNGKWLGWEDFGNAGNKFNSAPFAVCQGENLIDVFVMGPYRNTIWRRSWNGGSWSGWTDLGAIPSVPAAKAAAAAWGPGRLDVFTEVTPNSVSHSGWNGAAWSGSWQNLGGDVTFF
jgi:hypothetical protein